MSNRSSESRFLLQIKWIEQGCSEIKHFVCTTFLTETKELLRTGWVLSVFMLLEYSLLTTSVVFCGRLGQREMAAAALTQSIISILCFMPGYGMVTVCNTYFAAGFGSTDGQKQETILQKSLILSGLVSLLCWALLINTESILRLLQQEESIVLMVGVLVRAYLPAVPAVFASFVLSRFLQCRNHEMISMVAMVVAAVVNILLNYLFVIVMKGGASWSFGAVVIAQYIDLFILSAYVYKYEDFKGWTTESLDDWYEFSVIGINGCLMIELGIIIFEAGYLFCGTIDDLAMDVFGAVYIILFYTFMICSGLSAALAIRIGQSLGKNDPDTAKVSMQVAFVSCWIYAVIVSCLLFGFRNYIGYLFTDDRAIVDGIADIASVIIIYEISDMTGNVARGVLQGCGRQSVGALASFICYFFISLPTCVYLVLLSDWRAKGMWVGLGFGNVLQTFILLIYSFNIDWKKETELSQKRSGVQLAYTQVTGQTKEYSGDALLRNAEKSSSNSINGFERNRKVRIDEEKSNKSANDPAHSNKSANDPAHSNKSANDPAHRNKSANDPAHSNKSIYSEERSSKLKNTEEGRRKSIIAEYNNDNSFDTRSNEVLENMPLVGKSNGFKLSRKTIFMRIMNVSMSVAICIIGITYYMFTK